MTLICLALLLAAEPMTPVSKLYDSQLKMIEAEVLTLAEAMPAENYSFVPQHGEFKNVRTFGAQVGHIAATNYAVAAAILGEAAPAGPEKPEEIKSKEELVQYLKSSLVYAHKAVANITEANLNEPVKSPFGEGKTTRLSLGSVFAWHSMDHYGQMVVYGRLNGVVPPASKN